jgi:hypothetical protein
MSKTNAGKGDKPRNCFSKEWYKNYDLIFPKTSGRIIAEKIRKECNSLSNKERKELLKEGLKLINRGFKGVRKQVQKI